jgi:hypothetical protein
VTRCPPESCKQDSAEHPGQPGPETVLGPLPLRPGDRRRPEKEENPADCSPGRARKWEQSAQFALKL